MIKPRTSAPGDERVAPMMAGAGSAAAAPATAPATSPAAPAAPAAAAPPGQPAAAQTEGTRVPGAAGPGEIRDDVAWGLLVRSIRDYAIFRLDPAGHIRSWNAGAQRLKGYLPAEIIGRHFSTFYPPEDIANGKPANELKVAAREGRFEDEGWRLRKDGSRFWANVVITALRDDDGVLVGFGKITRDLTDRRRVEQTLRESEQRFRLLVESVVDYGIFMLDPDGTVASWNEGAQRINGYSAYEIVGRHFSVFYPAEDVARGKPEWELVVAGREGRFEDEGWRVRKDGRTFWASVIITAVHDEEGRLTGFSKVTRDLTDRRATQERAIADARRAAAADAANRAKSEFLRSMSHELRTPLNAIGGYADLLSLGISGPLSEEQRLHVERISQSQRHLLTIINDLLNYSRMEAGYVKYDIAPVSLLDVLESITPMIAPQVGEKYLTVRRGECSADAVALADRAKVEQIALNLLSNAVKFTPRGGTITLSCIRDGHAANLTVTDTGCGIPADMREAIFEPFVQLGRSLTTSSEGTGLGLSISRELARAMGGEILVSSTVGEGSAFTLALPAA